MVLSLIIENDVGDDVAMITCAAVGVMGFAKTVLFVVAWQLLAKRRSPAESVAKSGRSVPATISIPRFRRH